MSAYKTPNQVAIIGVGFCGLTTAIQLIRKTTVPIALHLINAKSPFGKGVAYSTDSMHHLLNVPAEKMSCLAEEPDHFLNWALQYDKYATLGRDIVKKLFLPRKEYGQYLLDTWNE